PEALGAVEGIAGEDVVAHEVGGRPDTELRIVREVRGGRAVAADLVGVAIPGPGRVAGGRDSDTLEVRRGEGGELADQPAVGELVVEHHRVAPVFRFADG